MVWIFVALGSAATMYVAALIVILRRLTAAPPAWRLLGWSGVPLALSGFGFVSRFWHPTGGPYLANEIYPFGSHLQAWAVSFGFTWIAFGLLFTGAVLLVSENPRRQGWLLLLVSWLFCLWPHAIIAIAFAWNGANRESVQAYARWSENPQGLRILVGGAFLTLWHFGFCIAGFVATGRRMFDR